jgi:hypothetical protein
MKINLFQICNQNMTSSYVAPNLTEGFDEIIVPMIKKSNFL